MKYFVSVIITAYNRQKYLDNTLNSVLNQTLDKDKFEIVEFKILN
ncbi:glycosyltransferase [Stygiolobus sp. CP850M]|jgi:glycosyltransferase involved in cell wall biosynthesis